MAYYSLLTLNIQQIEQIRKADLWAILARVTRGKYDKTLPFQDADDPNGSCLGCFMRRFFKTDHLEFQFSNSEPGDAVVVIYYHDEIRHISPKQYGENVAEAITRAHKKFLQSVSEHGGVGDTLRRGWYSVSYEDWVQFNTPDGPCSPLKIVGVLPDGCFGSIQAIGPTITSFTATCMPDRQMPWITPFTP